MTTQNNEPQYYLFQNINPNSKHYKGYYNDKEEFFYPNICNCTFNPSQKIADAKFVQLGFNRNEVQVIKVPENKLRDAIQGKLMKVSFMADILIAECNNTSDNFPNKSTFGKQLIHALNKAKEAAKNYSIAFSTLEEYGGEQTYENLEVIQEGMHRLSCIEPEQYVDMIKLFEAFDIDRKTMVNAANKVYHNHKKELEGKSNLPNQVSIYNIQGV